MPKFQKARLFLVISYLLLLIADSQLSIPFFIYFLPFGIFVFLCLYGSANIQFNFYTKAICKGKALKKQVALTFDDGPDAEITPQVLAILKQHNLPATFFLIGHKISGNEAIVQQIEREGHSIGNHSFSHSVSFDFKGTEKVREELRNTEELVFKIIGKKVRYFRPPFGVTNPHIAKAARLENYQVIGWNVRPYDAVLDDKSAILQRIKKDLKAGSIILLHDVKPLILEVLVELIPYLKKEGYEVVSLEDLIGKRAYF